MLRTPRRPPAETDWRRRRAAYLFSIARYAELRAEGLIDFLRTEDRERAVLALAKNRTATGEIKV